MATLLPISAVLPTRNRHQAVLNMLLSLACQSEQPGEIIVIDSSSNDETTRICRSPQIPKLDSKLRHFKTARQGAAVQRNQGLQYATHGTILFVDDDVIFEPHCIRLLWNALQSDSQMGGVSSMIVNQKYHPPGLASRWLFLILNGGAEVSYAGKCIGPALNLLPEDRPDLPETVEVEWLNTTCTLYRKEALPEPPFSDHFTGYSLMEDVALSLTVGREWKLANARTARIYHDSQSGDHKSNKMAMAKMQLVNRHYVMAHVLRRTKASDYAKLLLLQLFELITSTTSKSGILSLPANLAGRLAGAVAIASLTDPITSPQK